MRIDLNDRLALVQSENSWNLVEAMHGTSKKGEPITRDKITYHATPWQAVQYAVSKHNYEGELL